MHVTIRQRAHIAMQSHSLAAAEFRRSLAAGQFVEASLWQDTRKACLDELDECAHALSLGIEPEPAEILKGNADIHAP